jgi:hypothetical protein
MNTPGRRGRERDNEKTLLRKRSRRGQYDSGVLWTDLLGFDLPLLVKTNSLEEQRRGGSISSYADMFYFQARN